MKKHIALILSILMCANLCACGARQISAKEPKEDLVLKQILADAENRKQSILNSETSIVESDTFVKGETYTGTAYYVSNSGNDQNNGLSPETAFATMKPFNRVNLEYGDAVFFERGSLWRTAELPLELCRKSGITYSAYGEGEKPKFYGSGENGSGADKWDLYYEGATGKKIWLYYRDMTEVGSIVLNGTIPVNRDIAYWDEGTYYYMDEGSMSHGTYTKSAEVYSVEKHLPNMHCFPELNYPTNTGAEWNDDIFVYRDWETCTAEFATGKLYMRCDEGNPGELYESIEFMQPYNFATYAGGKDSVFDNLCIAYSCSTFGTGNNGWVIQNCEFGWMGGGVCNYRSVLEKDYSDNFSLGLNYKLFGRRGGAISLNNPQSTVTGTYVHHSFQEGISVEIFEGDTGASDILICDNLVEKCNQPMIICNWDTEIDHSHGFSNITIENNYVLYTGVDSLYNTEWEKSGNAAFTIQGGQNYHDGTVYIRNNIFALSEDALIVLPMLNDYMKVFEGNTYIQWKNCKDIFVGWETYHSLENIGTILGDETGTVILVD